MWLVSSVGLAEVICLLHLQVSLECILSLTSLLILGNLNVDASVD